MAFRELKAQWLKKYPRGVTERYMALDIYDKFLDGSFYDILPFPFEQEEEGKRVIPLRERRPLIQYSLPILMRDRQAAQLFGKRVRPRVRAYPSKMLLSSTENVDKDATAFIEAIIEDYMLYDVLSEALEVGQSGSACITVTALDDMTAYLDVIPGKNVRPVFEPRNPNKLSKIERLYPIKGVDLNQSGIYEAEYEPDLVYWMRIELDKQSEQWYLPLEDARYQKLGKSDENGRIVKWEEDDARSYEHGFGVVPAIWIRNLNFLRGIDGRCTFQSILDIQITLDYLASQITRGFHFTADPLLVVSRGELDDMMPAGGVSIFDAPEDAVVQAQDIDKTPAKALTIPSGSKAELLEISGQSLNAAREWFRAMRDCGLELLSGSNVSSEKTGEGNPHSGRALEMMNSLELWLIERQSAAYGDHGLVDVIRIILTGMRKGVLSSTFAGKIPEESTHISLMWPRRTLLLGQDLLNTMMALQAAAGGSQKEPRQLVPMNVITADAMAALGHPDPATDSEQVDKEWTDALDTKAQAQASARPTLVK